MVLQGFPGGSHCEESACNARDLGSIPGLGRFPGDGNGNPLQYPCLENLMNRGAWQAVVHGITGVGHNLALSFIVCVANIWKTEGGGTL